MLIPVFIITGGVLFLIGSAGFGFTTLYLKPRPEEVEEVYYEFEERDPRMRRYHFWYRFFLGMIVVSMLLLMVVFFV